MLASYIADYKKHHAAGGSESTVPSAFFSFYQRLVDWRLHWSGRRLAISLHRPPRRASV